MSWTFVSSSFSTNAIGTLTYDAATNTLYAGTGEPNASADSEAGFGIYKSTDGGNTWTHLAANTSVGAEDVDCGSVRRIDGARVQRSRLRRTLDLVDRGWTAARCMSGPTRGVRGVSSVLSGGVVSLAPGLPSFRIVEVHGRRRELHVC